MEVWGVPKLQNANLCANSREGMDVAIFAMNITEGVGVIGKKVQQAQQGKAHIQNLQ